MHLAGVRRSAEWHSGTQALEVQESARAGAHTETGTNACRSIGQRTTSTAEWCQYGTRFTLGRASPSGLQDEFIAADADEFIAAGLGQLVYI